jgi:hypothetical protein
MLLVSPGTVVEIPFVYRSGYTYVDPDISITLLFKRRF